MISMLSEGFWGEKLYAAMAAMGFAANPPMHHINRLSTHPELAMSLITSLYLSIYSMWVRLL